MLKSSARKFGSTKIAITQGELSGISPEIIAKSIEKLNTDKTLEIVVISTDEGTRLIKSNLKIKLSEHIEFINPKTEEIPEDIKKSDSLSCLYWAIHLATNEEVDAIVTAPLDKNKVAEKYPDFSGHTGFLKKILNVDTVLMLINTPSLKIGIMTEHLPLRDIPKNITNDRIINTVILLRDYLSIIKDDPVIGVLALNPHSGDSGLLGREEIEIISPAIKHLNSINIKAIGPIPADTAFTPSMKSRYDGILSMYHDQGMIPSKIRGMDNVINITLGLPIIRTSPGHGVAYDIAGKGIASPKSLLKAIDEAAALVLSKRLR